MSKWRENQYCERYIPSKKVEEDIVLIFIQMLIAREKIQYSFLVMSLISG